MEAIPSTRGVMPSADQTTEAAVARAEAFDRDALAASIQSKFSAVMGTAPVSTGRRDADDVEIDDPADTEVVNDLDGEDFEIDDPDDKGADQSQQQDAATDVADDLEDSDIADPVDQQQQNKPGQPTDVPTLPEPLRRTLRSRGWSDDQINNDLKMFGLRFVDTARRFHEGRNAETAKLAELGRQQRALAQGQNPSIAANGRSQRPAQAGIPELPEQIDTAELKKHYGDDPLIDKIVGPVNAILAAQNVVMQQMRESQTSFRQQQESALDEVVTRFFRSEEMKPYAPLYGVGAKAPTAEHVAKRNEVLDRADLIHRGATEMGHTMTVEEALRDAHDWVSSDFRVENARAGIRKQAKQRNQGLTQRPNGRRTPASSQTSEGVPADGSPLTREQLEARVNRRLSRTFKH